MDERVLIHPVNTMRPLTLEQLRGMDRPTPVWAEVEGKTIEGWDGYWCLCQNGKILAPSRLVEKAECMDGVEFYAYPPARIDREAWTAEWKDHYRSGTSAGTGYVCSVCDMWNGRKSDICPSCGRAMTDEAVQMVMERLEALYENT